MENDISGKKLMISMASGNVGSRRWQWRWQFGGYVFFCWKVTNYLMADNLMIMISIGYILLCCTLFSKFKFKTVSFCLYFCARFCLYQNGKYKWKKDHQKEREIVIEFRFDDGQNQSYYHLLITICQIDTNKRKKWYRQPYILVLVCSLFNNNQTLDR